MKCVGISQYNASPVLLIAKYTSSVDIFCCYEGFFHLQFNEDSVLKYNPQGTLAVQSSTNHYLPLLVLQCCYLNIGTERFLHFRIS